MKAREISRTKREISKLNFKLEVLRNGDTPLYEMSHIGTVAYNVAKKNLDLILTCNKVKELGIEGIRDIFYSIGWTKFVDEKLIPELEKRDFIFSF